jgi:hypothetical protein
MGGYGDVNTVGTLSLSLSLSLSLLSLMLLVLLMAASACSSGARGSLSQSPTVAGGQPAGDGKAGSEGYGQNDPPGSDDLQGGEDEGVLDGGGIGGGTLAGPTLQQSLFDFTQTGIAPWGPVLATHTVSANGQVYNVNELEDGDPFLGMYQLPSGDIVFTNRPLEQVVSLAEQEPLPPTEVWNGPDGPETIFSGQIMALFKPEVTQQQIEQFIAAHNLHVIFSWFEGPEEPGQGNAIASFQFRYDPLEFPTFAAAIAAFNADPLLDATMPNSVAAFQLDYVGGQPNDAYYAAPNHLCQQVDVLGVDFNPFITFGPPYGGSLSTTAVAVFDVGVDRRSEDFGVPPLNFDRKISWAGISSSEFYERVVVGLGQGNVIVPDSDPRRQGALASHGTQVAGTITAATNSNGRGVAGLAPQNGVLPVRLTATGSTSSDISPACVQNALVALRYVFDNGIWIEDIRVVNSSFGKLGSGPGTPKWKFYDKWYSRDALRCDRLHVASAGNDCTAGLQSPAGLDVVLGVSGLVCTSYGMQWFPNVTPSPGIHQGSNYWFDQNPQNPLSRRYPVSGIYGFTNSTHTEWYDLGYSTASPVNVGTPSSHYWPFSGTSFAAPQVAALAAVLRMRRPSATYAEVAARIVNTRDIPTENMMWNTYGIPLAGLVDYDAALQGW